MKKKIIAECIAEAGYGTSSYDPITYECEHECYAGVVKIIKNEKYWDQYEGCMSEPLNKDFNLGFNFDKHHLYVYNDGTTKSVRINNYD